MRRRPAKPLALTPCRRLNPIEMAFAKLKAHLSRIGARALDALWRAIGEICDLFTPMNAGTTSDKPGVCQNKRRAL